MKNIIVPVDGSKGSKVALEKAVEVAKAFNSKLTIVTVVVNLIDNPFLLEQEYHLDVNKAFVEQGDKILNKAKELVKDYEGEIETILKIGDPSEEIIKIVNEGDYDLLVMGNRGLNAFSRVMMGSVSNRVLNHVDISVLVAK